MSPKPLAPLAMKLMKGVVAVELLGLFGAYGLFHKMNNSQDFRSAVNRRCPSVLEVYYQSNEWAGLYGVRERDREAWAGERE
ncbi:protein CEBPZOS-like [Pseudoliparis swirei]|uniref:protein CEBPZOS-like n=1 Tax=Pseudoliparis swirei TaxID=2059687 RepID=UPI0024BE92C9|nr:protein CEBPZOS-like [Pseudoliparis swirei]XP_056283553.1 protein CEBPZOS-like [Pseudoliparis swirei]